MARKIAQGFLLAFLLILSIGTFVFGFQKKPTAISNDVFAFPKNKLIANIPVSPLPDELYDVVKVVDGDTIKININGVEETVRLIGINSPETVDPDKPVECFGPESSDEMKNLLSGQKVRIEKDPTQGDRDKYGRLLAYVWREDGLFINQYMVEQGYAREYTYMGKPYQYQKQFKASEIFAQRQMIGLWLPGVCQK